MKLARRIAKVLGLLVGLIALALALFVGATWAPDRPVAELEGRWAKPPSFFVEHEGMRVHVRDEGPRDDARPIVLLHGTSASLHTWEGWASALRDTRRVVRFDLPGFGLTGPAPDDRYDIERYATFVLGMLDRLGVQRCVLVGNSFGGRVAWATSLASDRVARLVLIDAAGYPPAARSMPIGFRVAQLPLLRRIMSVSLPRSVIVSSLRNVYGDPSKVTPELVDQYFELAVRAGNRRALTKRFEQAPSGPDAERIKSIKVPTLIVWGALDRLVPPEHAHQFHRDVAGSELVILDDLGHVPHEEDPVRSLAAVRAFL